MAQHHLIFITAAPLTLLLTIVAAQPASTGLLCISECVTCPVICSPPPSPSQHKLQPPPPPPSPPPPSPKHCSPPPIPPRAPPPPRFIYSFGGVPPPPRFYYGVLPAPPNEKGKPLDYEDPYAYYSAAACSSCRVELAAVFVLLVLVGLVV